MADTTKANVILIAPELAEQLESVAKVISVTPTVQNSKAYTIIINGLVAETFTYTSDSNATISEIISGLISAMSTSTLVNATNGITTLLLTAKTAGVDFTIVITANLAQTTTVDNYDGSNDLWTLLFADAIAEITDTDYSTDEEKAQRYYLAHMLTKHFSYGQAANLTSEKVGDVQINYGSNDGINDYKSTKYGNVFYALYLQHRRVRFI
jgi:hypothetical protein